MIATRRRNRSLFRPIFDQLDVRITPSEIVPAPTVPIVMGDPAEISILIPITCPTGTTGTTAWPSDPLLILAPTTPV